MNLFIHQPRDTVVMSVRRGTGMTLFSLHLMELARQAGYTVGVFPSTTFGVYNNLDQERFLKDVHRHEAGGKEET